ncbi:MAG: LamG-like jellyroll fold domain-containing protein [Haloferula sp.]
MIPETLNTLTLNSDHIIVRPYGGNPISGTISSNDKDIISFVPDAPLAANTTYEVILVEDGIEDVSGNGIEEFGFAFSTGPTLDPSPFTGLQDTYGNGGQPGTGEAWPLLNPGTVRIEAENFNQGGEGVAYHDTDAVNDGGAYRPDEGVDLSTTSDTGGGFAVEGTEAGEWMEYTIDAPTAGLYDLSLRVSNDSGSEAELTVLIGSDRDSLTDLPGTITVPISAFYTHLASDLSLPAGRQVLRLQIDQPGVEINWLELEGVATLVPSLLHYDFEGDTLDQTASGYDGIPRNFPVAPFTTDAAVGSEALTFDADNDYVAIEDLVYNSTTLPAVTISCWVNTTDGSDQVIASFDRNSYWRLSVGNETADDGEIGWHIITDAGQQDFASNRTIDDGDWHHVVATFDGAAEELRIYIDGVLDATQPNAGTVFGSSRIRYGFVGIGSEAEEFDGTTGPNTVFNGSLDDFHIFHDVLTQEQINHLFLQRNTPNSAPTITNIDVSAYPATTTHPVTITVTAIDVEGDPLEYRINPGDGSGFSEWQSSPIFEHTFASEGHYGISIQARDLFGSQSVATSGATVLDAPPTGPPSRSNSPIADIGNGRIMVVNPDNNSVTSIDTGSLTNEFEVPVGADPRSAAIASTQEIWVTCHDADRLDVLSQIDGSLITSIPLDYGAEPYGIAFSPDGTVGYVTLQGRGQLMEIDPVSRSVTRTLDIGPKPRALVVSPDGSRVLVTRFTSPETHGEVYDVDASSMTLTRVIQLARDTTPDNADGGRGVPNYLMGIAITPDGSKAWVSSQKANTDRGMFREGQALNHENTVRSILSCIDLATHAEDIAARIDIDNSNVPMGITFSPLGDYAFVALQANNFILDINLLGGETVGIRWPTGRAPQGLAYLPGTHRLIAKNFMDRTVTVFDTTEFVQEGKGLVNLATISTVASETLSAEVLLGKQIFYDAEDPRMALDGYQTCASCHQDGGTDNRVWDFTDRGEGLRNTTDLRARRGTGHGFVHWSANFDEIQDFEHDIRNAFLGEGFLTDTEFNTDSRNTTLGTPKAGVDADLDALAAYVGSLETVGRSPHRTAEGDLTADALAGRNLFTQLDCMTCHSGDRLTDSNELPVLHDVGTIKASSGDRLGSTLSGIDTPTLRGLWRTAPYLHDGSAATLQDIFTTQNPSDLHGTTSGLSATEIDQLAAYLLQIDDCEGSVNPESTNGFVLIDDFESYSLDSNLLGQGGWNTNPTQTPITDARITTDPDNSSDQVVSLIEITDNGSQGAIDNTVLEIEDGTTATVFFRMRHTAPAGDADTPMGVGTSDNGIHGHIDLQMKFRDGGDNGQLMTTGGTPDARDISRDIWFKVWWVITNGANGGAETMECYLQSDDDPDYHDIRLATTVTRESGQTDPIIDTLAFTKFNDFGLLLIDDIYYDDRGRNLIDPRDQHIEAGDSAIATMVSSQQIDLNWTGEPGAGIYYIEIADSSDGPWSPWKRLLGNPTSIAVDGLLPVSSYAFRISALAPDGELLSRDIVESTTQEPYDDWAQGFALAPEVYGKDLDPDGDGILNRFERAYGSSPLLADPSVRPRLEKIDGKWVMTYRYNPEAWDLTLVPELSQNLSLWNEDAGSIGDTLTGHDGQVELRQASPIDDSLEKWFLRLRLDSQY